MKRKEIRQSIGSGKMIRSTGNQNWWENVEMWMLEWAVKECTMQNYNIEGVKIVVIIKSRL